MGWPESLSWMIGPKYPVIKNLWGVVAAGHKKEWNSSKNVENGSVYLEEVGTGIGLHWRLLD